MNASLLEKGNVGLLTSESTVTSARDQGPWQDVRLVRQKRRGRQSITVEDEDERMCLPCGKIVEIS